MRVKVKSKKALLVLFKNKKYIQDEDGDWRIKNGNVPYFIINVMFSLCGVIFTVNEIYKEEDCTWYSDKNWWWDSSWVDEINEFHMQEIDV